MLHFSQRQCLAETFFNHKGQNLRGRISQFSRAEEILRINQQKLMIQKR